MESKFVFTKVEEDEGNEWQLPRPATSLSAGYDLRIFCPHRGYIDIAPSSGAMCRTNTVVAMPTDAIGMVVSRSGLAFRDGLIVLNSPGIIDADYHDEVCVLLFNSSTVTRRVLHGERIAQLVFVTNANPYRGAHDVHRSGGFGSTGTS
jgi:dUTP pyrophosphatase